MFQKKVPLTSDEHAQVSDFMTRLNALDPIERQLVIREIAKAIFADRTPEESAALRKSHASSPLN